MTLPGVGANLQDHLQIRSVYKVQDVKTLNTQANSLWGKAMIGLEYAFKRSGPMSMAPSQLGAFTRSDPSQPYPNVEYHVQPLSLDAFGEPLHSFQRPSPPASATSTPPAGARCRSRVAGFQGCPGHCTQLPQHRRRPQGGRRFVAPDAHASWRSRRWPDTSRRSSSPASQYQSDDDLARLAGDIATTIFHPVGTTKMGRADDPMAVLDAHLRVRGGGVIAGLRVVDAGVMPVITSGNTNSPTLMMAEKAAHWIAEDGARGESRPAVHQTSSCRKGKSGWRLHRIGAYSHSHR